MSGGNNVDRTVGTPSPAATVESRTASSRSSSVASTPESPATSDVEVPVAFNGRSGVDLFQLWLDFNHDLQSKCEAHKQQLWADSTSILDRGMRFEQTINELKQLLSQASVALFSEFEKSSVGIFEAVRTEWAATHWASSLCEWTASCQVLELHQRFGQWWNTLQYNFKVQIHFLQRLYDGVFLEALRERFQHWVLSLEKAFAVEIAKRQRGTEQAAHLVGMVRFFQAYGEATAAALVEGHFQLGAAEFSMATFRTAAIFSAELFDAFIGLSERALSESEACLATWQCSMKAEAEQIAAARRGPTAPLVAQSLAAIPTLASSLFSYDTSSASYCSSSVSSRQTISHYVDPYPSYGYTTTSYTSSKSSSPASLAASLSRQGYSKAEICRAAGYSGHNNSRDFNTLMSSGSLRNPSSKAAGLSRLSSKRR